MKGIRGFNLIGLHEALSEMADKSRKPTPWGITAKEGAELKKPGKAPEAKKKHRRMVQESKKRNRT